jgi:SulP family sulfate permease
VANSILAFFQGFPVAGSLTRTLINIETGATTSIASITTSIITLLALLFFLPIFYYLPKVVLAAIIVFSAVPLIDLPRLREMYRISRTDGFVAFFTFALAFFLKSDQVILIGVIAALAIFIRQTVVGARVVEMGIDRELQILRGALNEKNVHTFSGVVIARVSMSIYYANVAHIISEMDEVITRNTLREGVPVRAVVFDVSAVNFIDITGIEMLQDYFKNLQERGIRIGTIYMRRSIREPLERVPDFPKFQVFRNIADMRGALLLSHK